jgi:hypothetical protein
LSADGRDPDRRPVDLYLLGALLLLVFVAQQWFTEGVTSDGNLYFAYLRSVVFDHDLQIGPELDFLGLPPRPHNVVPVGPSILWTPFYLIVAAADWLGAAAGWWTRASGVALGLTAPYKRAVYLGSFAMAAAGLAVLHLRIRRDVGGALALLTSILVLLATPLAWYIVMEPSMTHAGSFGAVAIALVASERWLNGGWPSRRQALAIGALFSLAIVVRPEDGLFLIFPAAALLWPRPHAARSFGSRLRAIAGIALGALPLAALLVVMLVLVLRVNTYTVDDAQSYLTLLSPRLGDVLFSSRHGLFSWTPVVWAALIGTVLYTRKNPRWAWPALAALAVLAWINGSAHDWAGGWAFGGRRFVSLLAALAPGLALAAAQVRRHPVTVLAPLTAGLVAWNVTLMAQYHGGRIPRDETISWADVLGPRLGVVARPPLFYPFGFPANVWFAWREGLPIARHDLLGSEPLRREMYLPLNDWGARFLMDGWVNGASDAFGSAHFLGARSGTILVPLDVPRDTAFGIDLEARADGQPAGAATGLELAVNGQSFGELPLQIGAPRPSRRVFVVPAGARIWRRGYNRVTISRPSDAAPTTMFIVYALRVGASAGGGRVP